MKEASIWQRCPICNGDGKVDGQVCPTCNGRRIISMITGRPPNPLKP